jgi:hypothetical protein
VFFGLPDPDTLVSRGMDPDPDPSIMKQAEQTCYKIIGAPKIFEA